MKEEQKIFNYDTLWSDFLEEHYIQLDYKYNKLIINGIGKDLYDFKEFYRAYFRYEVNYEVYVKYGYRNLLSLLDYCKNDLLDIINSLDDDLHNIIKDYAKILCKYQDFYYLVCKCEELKYTF